jgi:histidine ammonia-lyase
MERVDRGHKVVLEAALQNVPVYGLTRGVGLNKDRPVFKEVNGQKVLSEEVLNVSRQFNLNSLRSHAGAAGEPMSAEVVRAAMLIRLNTMLSGVCGAQRDVAQHYIDFLNKGIVPVVPSAGTVGEADITLASHIGLVMVGEWEAFYQGRRVSGAEALNTAGIQPLRPVGHVERPPTARSVVLPRHGVYPG